MTKFSSIQSVHGFGCPQRLGRILTGPAAIQDYPLPIVSERDRDRMLGMIDDAIEGFTPAAMECLCNYGWAGKSREIRNVIERTIALTQGNRIDLNNLPPTLREQETRWSPGVFAWASFSQKTIR